MESGSVYWPFDLAAAVAGLRRDIEALTLVPVNNGADYIEVFRERLRRGEDIFALDIGGYEWLEIDDPSDYDTSNARFREVMNVEKQN